MSASTHRGRIIALDHHPAGLVWVWIDPATRSAQSDPQSSFAHARGSWKQKSAQSSVVGDASEARAEEGGESRGLSLPTRWTRPPRDPSGKSKRASRSSPLVTVPPARHLPPAL